MKTITLTLAILFASQAYGQEPDRLAIIYFNDGYYKLVNKKFAEAINSFSRAIDIDKGFTLAYTCRGEAKFGFRDYSGAIADYDLVLEMDPYDKDSYGRRGRARFFQQDLTGAIEDLNIALEDPGDHAQFYIVRGEAKYYLQDFDGALADFNKVIRLSYGDRQERAEALFWRGLVRINQNDRTTGCLDFSKAGKMGFAKAEEMKEIYCP